MMAELKFIDQRLRQTGDAVPASCGCESDSGHKGPDAKKAGQAPPSWSDGTVVTPSGPVFRVSTLLSAADRREHMRCRLSAFRENYAVPPGLYAVGAPGKDSDVLVSANYKLSFDTLRRELNGLDAWLLVLDTKGINVWCAAGKGTFGTDELVRRIASVRLADTVAHSRIIVPQLGAPGMQAHTIRKATGFKVLYGPVRASDIPAYIRDGYKASQRMRRVEFTIKDRLVLTPMEINPALKKYPLYALIVLLVFGLRPSGIIFEDAVTGGMPFLVLGLVSILAGALLTPLLLPFVPFRSFALKGWIVGGFSAAFCMQVIDRPEPLLAAFSYVFFPLASSYVALQFTGSTTFTGMSGVKKELKVAVPLYIALGAVSAVLLIVFKLNQWGVI
jgi:hypothetical protein